jgi:acylphosphatase
MGDVQASLRIRGRVQGVFFRHSATREAIRLGLTGWIRNCIEGDVEAVAEGPRARVNEFIAWCRKGPPYAKVESVEVKEAEPTGEFSAFRVEH